MQIRNEAKQSSAVKFTAEENGKEVGRAYLYLVENELHEKPYGLLEDVFVDESVRGTGIGTKLVQAVVQEAKRLGCYKLVGTSRHSRTEVHKWYEKLGFKNYGLEFRMDFIQ